VAGVHDLLKTLELSGFIRGTEFSTAGADVRKRVYNATWEAEALEHEPDKLQ
jgi:hypothetical protein